MNVERLERRALLTTLAVDNADLATCGAAGDNLYCEIQEAVDAAQEGDQIDVHSGTYRPVVIDKNNLTIREAEENSNPVIDGGLNPGHEDCVVVSASGVTIQGLKAINASSLAATGRFGNGFVITGGNNVLLGNTAKGNSGNGFEFRGNVMPGGSDNNRLVGNTAKEHVVGFLFVSSHGNRLVGNNAKDNSNGFSFTESSDNTVSANTAKDNFVGFWIGDFTSNNTFVNNTAARNRVWGFFAIENPGFEPHTFIGNIAKNNVSHGFRIDNIGNTLAGNIAKHNGEDGFTFSGYFFDTHSNTVTGNIAKNNGRDGFSLAGSVGGTPGAPSHSNTLSGNTAAGNGRDGYHVGESHSNTFSNNIAKKNDEYGFQVDFVIANVFEDNLCKKNGLRDSSEPGVC